MTFRSAVGGLILAAVTLAGCSGASNGPGQTPAGAENEAPIVTISYDEMVAEFEEHTQTLQLPADAEWPPPPAEPEKTLDSEGILRGTAYEEGIGASVAAQAWWCEWAIEWLQQRGMNDDLADEALATMHTVPETAFYASMDASTKELFTDMLDAADLGDPTLIANDVDLNCSH